MAITKTPVTDIANYDEVSPAVANQPHLDLEATIDSIIQEVEGGSLDADLLGGNSPSYYANVTARLGYTPLNRAGDTMTGFLTLSGDPTSALHAVTKQYADSLKAGLATKDSVKVATTSNISLSGAQTIDGINVVAGDRVLVKDQSTASQNGVYVASNTGWTRAPDFDENVEVEDGAYVFVENGAVNDNSGWVMSNDSPNIGSDAIQFTQFSGAGQINAGFGLSKTGNTIEVNLGTSTSALNGADIPVVNSGSLGSNTVEGVLLNLNSQKFNASGGTISGSVTITSNSHNQLTIRDSGNSGSSAQARIDFDDSANTRMGYVGFGSNQNRVLYLVSDNDHISLNGDDVYFAIGTPFWASTIWRSGNDGPGSGLNADLLDGNHGSYYTNASNIATGTLNNARLPNSISISNLTTSGNISVGNILSATNIGTANGTEVRIGAGETLTRLTSNAGGELIWLGAENGVRIVSSPDNWQSAWSSRHEAVLVDSNGNSTLPGNLNVLGMLYQSGNAVWHTGNFNPASKANTSGTYASLRAQATTSADVGLGNVTNVNTANASNISSGTLSAARLPTNIGGRQMTYVDLANSERDYYSVDGRVYFDSSEGIYVMAQNALHANPALLWSSANVSAGNGIDVVYGGTTDRPTISVNQSQLTSINADRVDGLHASSFIRSDTPNNVSTHVEWQDNWHVRFGNNADWRMWYDSAETLRFWGYYNGSPIDIRSHDLGGTLRQLIYADPDHSAYLYYNGNEKIRTDNAGCYITGRLYASADVVAYSDQRLKTVLSKINGVDRILDSIDAYRVKWNGSGKEDITFLSQEVQKVLPEFVEENEEGILGLKYSGMTTVLWEAVKQLRNEVREIKRNL